MSMHPLLLIIPLLLVAAQSQQTQSPGIIETSTPHTTQEGSHLAAPML